ncbi:precorrin-2 C(20)-methyltransferase [Stappia sp. ES.058]|uniref:precorrin-2 C(20)-methyltransferase n=1 Tax=Stappia sp. ES.058 TaxID=1881061 RepID=UPI00087D0038|nr:precorrin-2 C(20)-methyltransferase [Stappia sp. ES.058]SDU48678.1 precorrin-2/cobalt-factor-2 C20-methyltransferase [Stappia sp. ES.058]
MSDLHAPASNRLGGTFYGVGLGPGDPELMTLKAHRLISNARIIAYPAPDDGESFARSIAADAIRPDAREIPIVVPMRVDRFPARAVYDKAAEKIGAALDDGHDVVTLCEGDPFFYGSFMYLFERLSPRFACEIVPGVTSLTACAARLGRPLTARNDVLTVIPGPLPDDEIRPRIEAAGAVAIMKVGRHLDRLTRLLDEMGLLSFSGYAERATLANEQVMPLASVQAATAPYFSMILIYKGDEAWMLPPQSSS